MRWLKITRGKAHAVLHRHGSEVEFHCGKMRDDADLVLAFCDTPRCKSCEAYIRHGKEQTQAEGQAASCPPA